MTQHPNPADLRPQQYAEVARLFAAFRKQPGYEPLEKALREARENIGIEEAPDALPG